MKCSDVEYFQETKVSQLIIIVTRVSRTNKLAQTIFLHQGLFGPGMYEGYNFV